MNGMKTVFVAGHRGMVGSAICRLFERSPDVRLITACRDELDLTDQKQVREFFGQRSIDVVYLAAAKVGGIHANNTYPAEFIYQNLMIQANVINAAFLSGVKRLLFLGSSCIYPRLAKQPIDEGQLFTGQLESTNEPYALAKIAGIKLCESYNRQYGASHGLDYRSVMPTNLYGPGDNYHPENSHVIPGLIRRFHEAVESRHSQVAIWGSGKPLREFLHVDDLASACKFIMDLDEKIYKSQTQEMCSHINVGSGEEVTIRELANLIADVVGFEGDIVLDPKKEDGTPRKLLDSSRIHHLGWRASIELREGLKSAYSGFLSR